MRRPSWLSVPVPGGCMSWLLLFVLAMVVRLAVTAVFQGLDAPPDEGAIPDQVDYEEFAWQLSQGHGYAKDTGELTAVRPPGTSFTLLPMYLWFGRSFLAARVWFCLISALTCLLTGWLTRVAFGARAGLLAGLWMALYPGHLYYSMHFLSEVVYAFWIAAACGACLLGWKRSSLPLHALAGLLLGMAILTRPQALLLVPLAVGIALLAQRRKEFLRAVLVHGLMAALVVVPWAVRNHQVVGKYTLATIGGWTFWGAHNEVVLNDPDLIGSWIPVDDLIDEEHPVEGTEVEREAATYRYAFDVLRGHTDDLPRLGAMKMVRLFSPFHETSNRPVYWSFLLAWLVTGPLALVGLFLALRRNPLATHTLLAPIVALTATAAVFYGSVRFRDSTIPMFVALAAVAVDAGWRRWVSDP